MSPESGRGRGRWLLAAALLVAFQAKAETGSEWFEAQVRAGQAVEDAPSPSRARFMACGYVAPILSAPPAPGSADTALMQMLESLRGYLRRLGSGP